MISNLLRHALVGVYFLATPLTASADARSDATYIAQQSLTEEMFRGAFTAQRPVLISAIQNDLRAEGIKLNKPDIFFDLFIEAFIDEFVEGMQRESIEVYLQMFTVEELSGITTFYMTDTGQAFLKKSPELMQRGADIGMQIGFKAGANAGPRLAKKLREEGVLEFEDPGILDRLIDILD